MWAGIDLRCFRIQSEPLLHFEWIPARILVALYPGSMDHRNYPFIARADSFFRGARTLNTGSPSNGSCAHDGRRYTLLTLIGGDDNLDAPDLTPDATAPGFSARWRTKLRRTEPAPRSSNVREESPHKSVEALRLTDDTVKKASPIYSSAIFCNSRKADLLVTSFAWPLRQPSLNDGAGHPE